MNKKIMLLVVLMLVGIFVVPIAAQPIAHYTFDDGTATDVSGNGYDGILLSDPNAAAQVVEDPEMGHVLQLNGRGMQVDGPFDITTSFTLASWIKIDIPRVGRFLSGGPWWFRTDDQSGSDHIWIEARYPEDQFLDKFNTATETNPEGQLDGQWHHYAFVLDDTGKFIAYFDGVPAPARDGSEKAHDFAGAIEKIFFGTQNENFGNALQGYIDDIRVFNYAVEPNEIPYLLVPPVPPRRMIAQYTFDDGTAMDVTGNGYDGILLSDPNTAAQIVEDPEMGQVLQINERGMQVDGPFDITTSFTLASWIKIDIPRVGRFFSGGPWWFRTDDQSGSDHIWIEARYPEGQFLDKFNTATETNPEGQLDGQWHHYAFVLDDTGKFITYFDGVPAPARDGSERAHDFAGAIEKIFFGTQNENFGNALQGYMDDIRVFNYAVEPNDIPDLLVPPQTIAQYTFDDGTATDVSGNGYDGTLLGDPNAVAQVVEDPERGQVLQLNGRGMQVDGPFDIATSFTLASWIKIDIPRVGRFFSGGPWWFRTDDQSGSDHTWIEARYPEGQFLDKFNTATEANPEGQLDGQWHHYAFVLDKTGKFITYFDGVPAPARDGSERAHDFAGAIEKIFFGTQNENFGNALQGYMDDIILLNYTIRPYEIYRLMGIEAPGLRAQFTFNDGTAADVSGNGYNGILLSDPNAAAQVVEDPEMGHVLQLNGRGMQVDGPFDITTSFTLASWIKIDIPRVGRFFSGGPWWFRTDDQSGSDHIWIEARYPEGQFLDKFNTATEANPEGQLDGQWHHYAFVLDDTGKFIAYFDGVPAPARDGSERVHDFNGIDTIFFGTQNENFSNALQGYMDDITLYNVSLSAEEILILMGY